MKIFPARPGLIFLPALLVAFSIAARADQIIYDDALENGWQNWGWATIDYGNPVPVHSGSKSVSVTFASAWQGFQVCHADMDSTPFASISFWLNGGSSGGQKLQVFGLLHTGGTQNQAQKTTYPIGPLAANRWQQFKVPLSRQMFPVKIHRLTYAVGAAQPAFFVDDITLLTAHRRCR